MSPSLAHNAAFQDTEVDEDIAAAAPFNHMWSQGSTPGEIDRAEQSLIELRLTIEMSDIPQTSSQSACCPHGPWPKRGVSPPPYPFLLYLPQPPSLFTSPSFSPVCSLDVIQSNAQLPARFSWSCGSAACRSCNWPSQEHPTHSMIVKLILHIFIMWKKATEVLFHRREPTVWQTGYPIWNPGNNVESSHLILGGQSTLSISYTSLYIGFLLLCSQVFLWSRHALRQLFWNQSKQPLKYLILKFLYFVFRDLKTTFSWA